MNHKGNLHSGFSQATSRTPVDANLIIGGDLIERSFSATEENPMVFFIYYHQGQVNGVPYLGSTQSATFFMEKMV